MKSTAYAVALLSATLFFSPIAGSDNETGRGIVEQEVVVEQIPQETPKPIAEEEKPSRGAKREIYMEVTAYTAAEDECGRPPSDPNYGRTASGKRVARGMCAAGPGIPFGTRLYIEGIGEVVVEDRGGAISNNHIDVYVETKSEANRVGRRARKVTFI